MNRRRAWTLAILSSGYSFSLLAFATDCDCTKFPFKPDPPCYKQCTSAILKTSSKSQLQRILGLSPGLAEKISAHQAALTESTLFENLTAAEQDELNERLKGLSQSKLDKLRATDR